MEIHFTPYPVSQDKKSTNQNSGVRVDATEPNGNINTYYGRIEDEQRGISW
jgi:hypothetical protein